MVTIKRHRRPSVTLARLRRALGPALVMLGELAGIAVLAYGFWLAWHPLGYVVGALAALWILQGLGDDVGRSH